MAAMPTASSNGIELCYDTFGDAADPTMLLVMGLGSQMIHWNDDLCDEIVGRGFHVVRFDNRDTGESTWLDGLPATVKGALAGGAVDVPYLLADMADDAVGLLDHLGVDRAHVFGVSMGGMIAQTIAIRHPARVASLASIMSTTGDPDVGTPTPEAMAARHGRAARHARRRTRTPPSTTPRCGAVPGCSTSPGSRETAGRAWDRGVNPAGTARQLVAIMSSGSRSVDLAALDVPTVVVHGTADTLVQPTGGERTAEVIPDAKFVVIEGMGHDLAAAAVAADPRRGDRARRRARLNRPPEPRSRSSMGPLSGITVIEIAGIGPGPFCGDDARRHGRRRASASIGPARSAAAIRQRPPADLLNRGRRSVGVDLKSPDGVETVLDARRARPTR